MNRANWHYGPQRTPEWDSWRNGRVTGSRMSTVLAHGRDGEESKTREDYLVQLATERDTGVPIKMLFENEDMRNGVEREAPMRGLFEQVTGEMVDSSVGFIDHPSIEWFGVSPDGILMPAHYDDYPTEGLEGKCPKLSTFTRRVLSQKVPMDHVWQCMTLMECAALERVRYVNYHPSRPTGQQLLIIVINRDERLIRQLVDGVKLFNEEVEEYREALRKAKYF